MGIIDKVERSFGCIPIIYRPPPTRVLLIQQKSRTKTFWTFPKGHPEDNESPKETAIRELHEETGLRITEKDILTDKGYESHYINPERNGPKIVTLWPVSIRDEESIKVKTQEAEVAAFEWLTITDAMERLEYDNDRAALKDILEKRLGGEP